MEMSTYSVSIDLFFIIFISVITPPQLHGSFSSPIDENPFIKYQFTHPKLKCASDNQRPQTCSSRYNANNFPP